MLGYDYAQYFETNRIKNHSVTAPIALLLLGDDDVQSFEKPKKNNHSVNATNDHILLVSDSLQRNHKSINYRTGQKLLTPRKWYLCFKMDNKTDHIAQCSKLRALTKVIDLIIEIESFEQKCGILKGL